MPTHTRVGAVHALLASIDTTQAAFERGWPEADVAHLLDGSLYLDRSRGTADEAEIARRIARLIEHSAATGAEGILFTGSFFGPAVRAARKLVTVPVLTSFDGIIDSALALDAPLAVVSTATDSARYLADEVSGEGRSRGREPSVTTHVVDGAMDALIGGDSAAHDRMVLDAVTALSGDSAVLIAQFSMERVIVEAQAAASSPVLGTATEGAALLREVLSGNKPAPR